MAVGTTRTSEPEPPPPPPPPAEGDTLAPAELTALDGYAPTMLGNLPLGSWLLGGLGVIVLLAAWPGDPD